MSVFAAVIDNLFADPNIARDATYIAGGGAPKLIRVVTRRADEVTGFGEARLWSETTRIDLRVTEVPTPRCRRRAQETASRSRARPFSFRASRCGTESGWSGP